MSEGSSRAIQSSPFFLELDPSSIERYKEKLTIAGGIDDPYVLTNDISSNEALDWQEWPNLEYPDIYNYLVTSFKEPRPPHLSENDSKRLIPVRLAKHVKPIFERLCSRKLLAKCVLGATQNQNESFYAARVPLLPPLPHLPCTRPRPHLAPLIRFPLHLPLLMGLPQSVLPHPTPTVQPFQPSQFLHLTRPPLHPQVPHSHHPACS